jgi:hypothetical protein
MAVNTPKEVRGRILTVLYDTFQRDPLVMMTPSDIADEARLRMEVLAANCHYLHDRNFIELMMGYNPPLFAAARIAPEGIDLYEDRKRFKRFFSEDASDHADVTAEVIPLVMALGREAETAPLTGLKREWLLADLSRLRDLLRRPQDTWDADHIRNALQWLEGQAGPDAPLPSLAALAAALARRIK